jgi:4-hydroxysphinganine ceramide fatty acyl 2-hydroxylase
MDSPLTATSVSPTPSQPPSPPPPVTALAPRDGVPLVSALAFEAFRVDAPTGSLLDTCDARAYELWLSRTADGAGTLFGGPIEWLSHTPPWLPAALWLPLAALMAAASAAAGGPAAAAAAVAAGVVAWSALEYALHRGVFHALDGVATAPAWAVAAHFMLHGIHHHFPLDASRLVMPPPVTLAVAAPLYAAARALTAAPLANGFISGLLIGYVGYDAVHFAVHHGVPRACRPCLRGAVRRHARHHSAGVARDFGVSTAAWDRACGTAGAAAADADE